MQSRWAPAITITAGVLLTACGPTPSDVPSPSPTTPVVTIPGSPTVRPVPTPTSPGPTPGRDDGLITDPAY